MGVIAVDSPEGPAGSQETAQHRDDVRHSTSKGIASLASSSEARPTTRMRNDGIGRLGRAKALVLSSDSDGHDSSAPSSDSSGEIRTVRVRQRNEPKAAPR